MYVQKVDAYIFLRPLRVRIESETQRPITSGVALKKKIKRNETD